MPIKKRSIVLGSILVSATALAIARFEADDTRTNQQPMMVPNERRQSTDPEDLAVTRMIREELKSDATLSADAKKVDVVTSEGKVRLKGKVQWESEKVRVEQAARKFAGGNTVVDELKVVR